MTHHPRRSPTSKTPLWHIANVEIVKAHLANAALPHEPPNTIGDITLMPHQRHALARVRDTIRRFHGALLADEVGLGKTYVALALAREYDMTHVIAPAALLPMWKAAIARAAALHVSLQSLQSFSHPHGRTSVTDSPITPATSASASPSSVHRCRAAEDETTPIQTRPRRQLVIIDEAHHLRTRHTKRYHAVAQCVAGRDLLLLSATPIHNSARELQNLLALFTGQRGDLLDAATLSLLVIRQDDDERRFISSDSAPATSAAPRVHEHPPIRISSDRTPHDRASLDAILTLPDPLPARDGAVAGALIRLGLLRAWCSSNATLCHVIRRRILRGEALKQALQAGRHPSQSELRTWLVGDHEVQLAFPELLAQSHPNGAPLIERLDKHLIALRALLDSQRSQHTADAARTLALREIVARHPDTPIIAFSQFSHTVHALYRALSDIAGVGALTGMHARIASGRIARLDAIARFAPHAQGQPQPPPHQAIRLLLATDLLAEGVNLQDAAVVVHLDLPWTDALKRQRVGRIARLGSPHADVHVYTIDPPILGDHALQLSNRLRRKAGLAARLIGTPTPTKSAGNTSRVTRVRAALVTTDTRARLPIRRGAASSSSGTANSPARLNICRAVATSARPDPARHSAPALAALLNRKLRSWQDSVTHPADGPPSSIPVASVPARTRGWIAAINGTDGPRLVAHVRRTGTDLPLLAQAISVELPDFHNTPPEVLVHPGVARETTALCPSARQVAHAHTQLDRWFHTEYAREAFGAPPTALSAIQQRALRCLTQTIAELPPMHRHGLASLACTAEVVVLAASAEGPQNALARWTADVPEKPVRSVHTLRAWLISWREFPALKAIADVNAAHTSHRPPASHAGVSPEIAHGEPTTSGSAHSLLALLLLRPTTAANAALCSGYDATRPPL